MTSRAVSSPPAALPTSGSGPQPPWEFKGVVRLTRIGTTYIISTVVLAVSAINTGNNALYIAVSFMLGCLLLSGIASKSGLSHLDVEITGIDEAWAGKPAPGILHVRNRSRVWNVRDVILTGDALAAPVLVPIVPRRGEKVVYSDFLFPRRGRAHVNRIDSYTRYPFGFFLKKRRLRIDSEVIVFPHIRSSESVEERFRAEKGEQTSVVRRGLGTDTHSFRDYTAGDSMRHVAWKKSANAGRWIIKQTAADAARSINVVVNPYRPPGTSDERFEEMISEAATFIFHAATRGVDITLSLPRVNVRARESESPEALFRALALLEPLHEPVTLDGRNAVVFAVGGGHHDAKSA
ncbi:MAG TPA: DUF58 domain-containing protein [Thermoanaerobaculia bacterium]